MDAEEAFAYEQATQEVLRGTYNKALMAKAFANADGAQDKTRALYIRWRAQELLASQREASLIAHCATADDLPTVKPRPSERRAKAP